MKSYKRNNCRLCKSKNLKVVLKLTPTPPADSYVPANQLDKSQPAIPLDLYLCGNCGHTQIGHVINAREVYLNYIYETASTLGLGDHFERCANEVMSRYKPSKDRLALDIGSNDGILLKHFKNKGMQVLGIDPMPGIAEKASKNGIPTLDQFFNRKSAKELTKKIGFVSIICSNNLVADTDNLDDFVEGVKALMDKDSIFFFETFYLYLQIKNNVWDFTYHEHYSYFTVKPLNKYFHQKGFELIDVIPNETKGGSMRFVLQLLGGTRKKQASVQSAIRTEENEGFGTEKIFKRYQQRINLGRDKFKKVIDRIKKSGKSIAGYGASATSTTLIYHYRLGKNLDYLIDDFKAKQGLFSPGYHIPVYSPSVINRNPPDYIIILAWRYYKKIVLKHKAYLKNGGHFIIPLPKLKIL